MTLGTTDLEKVFSLAGENIQRFSEVKNLAQIVQRLLELTGAKNTDELLEMAETAAGHKSQFNKIQSKAANWDRAMNVAPCLIRKNGNIVTMFKDTLYYIDGSNEIGCYRGGNSLG